MIWHTKLTSWDLLKFYRSVRRRVWLCAAISGALASGLYLVKAPLFSAKATFRDAGIKEEQSNGRMLKELMGNSAVSQDARAAVVMKSRDFLIPICRKLGMQVSQVNPFCPRLKRLSPNEGFCFSDVAYDGSHSTYFSLVFDADGEYEIEGISCTLEKKPLSVKPGKKYLFRVDPMEGVLRKIKGRLRVTESPLDHNVIDLSFKFSSRERSADFLNVVMGAYVEAMQEEQKLIASEQIAFLKERQAELFAQYEKDLVSYKEYLEKSVGYAGFISLKHVVEALKDEERGYMEKEQRLDFEILQSIDELMPDQFADLGEMKLERDSLVASLEEMESAHLLRADFDNWKVPQLIGTLPSLERGRLQPAPKISLQGLDLKSARARQLVYQERLEALGLEARRINYQMDLMTNPDFEFGSLQSLVSDPACQALVREAAELRKQFVEGNLIDKERARITRQLNLKLGRIRRHLSDRLGLIRVEERTLEKNVQELEAIMVHLLDRDIAISEKQLEEKLGEHRKTLGEQKSYLKAKRHALQKKSGDLPTRWLTESLINMRAQLGMRLLSGTSELLHSKAAQHQLKQILSRPIESAIQSEASQFSMAYLVPVLGMLIGWVASVGYLLARQLRRGFAIALESLRFQGFRTATRLESLTLSSAQVLATVGPLDLAELCVYSGERILVIDCDFNQLHAESEIGLVHYLKGEIEWPPIRSLNGYAKIASGGNCEYGGMLLRNKAFAKLLSTLRERYDRIILATSASATSVETPVICSLADEAVITLKDERFEDLAPYLHERSVFLSTSG
ncbi:MAG: hypothetical protein MRY21_00295 [Simkaniaceae bacterium]|nr:hypothetical protein [Simkaniaceae bacterium]